MDVAALAREAFGLDVVAVEPVTFGTDRAASVWRATTAEGDAYAVKSGASPTGPRVCRHLAGVPGVPPTRWDEASRTSVQPWVGTRRATDGGMDERRWHAFGTLLRRVHDAAPLDGLPREEHVHERQAATVVDLDARESGTLDGWDSAAVHALVARAGALRGEVTDAPYVICHGDPWAGNVLLDDGDGDGGVWLVDWDDAVLAPRERDLMLVTCGVRDWAPFGEGGEEAFREGYGAFDADATRLAYYLCVRAMEDLDVATTALDATSPDAEWARRIVRGLFAPEGPVTRALSR